MHNSDFLRIVVASLYHGLPHIRCGTLRNQKRKRLTGCAASAVNLAMKPATTLTVVQLLMLMIQTLRQRQQQRTPLVMCQRHFFNTLAGQNGSGS